MQNDATVGRVLLASLHQAIAEVLPDRLEFYERWLTPWPASRVLGVASFTAMLTFLQREDGAADAVTARAGQYAAVRAFGALNILERALLRVLPRRLRARRAIRLLVRVLPALYPETRLDTIRRGRTVFVGIDESPFCVARGPEDRPTCSFYASTVTTFLQLLDLRPAVRISRCRSTGSKSCLLMVIPHEGRTAADGGILDLTDGVIEVSASESVPVEDAASIATAAANETPASNTPAEAAEIATQEDAASPAEITPPVEAPPLVDAPRPVEPPPVEAHQPVEATQPTEASQPVETAPPQTAAAPIEEAPVAVLEAEPASREGAASPDAPAASHAAPDAAHEVSEAPARPLDFADRWAAISAKRTSPRPRLNVEALFTRPLRPGEDPETFWHRV